MQRHDFDPVAFVFGLAFTGLGVLFMVGRLGLFNHARWLWPGLLLLLGIAVLTGARGRGGSRTPEPVSRPSALDAGPPPDLDSLDPPVGPEAFHLPGWPPVGARPEPAVSAGEGARSEPEMREEAADSTTGESTTGESTTEVLPEADPNAETEVLPPPRPPRPPEPRSRRG